MVIEFYELFINQYCPASIIHYFARATKLVSLNTDIENVEFVH